MTAHKKKQIHILIVATLVTLVVVSLYSTGVALLQMVRTAHPFSFENSKEVIYSYINNGDIRVADEILANTYEISRFDPVVINQQTWKEDPFSDLYWRFNYYNLEPVRNLLFAWVKTGNVKYKDKLIQITESFIDNGMNGPYSWDYHGTAFRTMTLIDVYWKLREKNELSPELDAKILSALKIHGDFLADPAHFEKDYNHGLDQAGALYLLAVNFPTMPGADTWLTLSSDRIAEVSSGIVDTDGVLVENSPYYHLYVLEKLWDINKYLKENNLTIHGFSEEKINQMISYVVYILHPDLTVPTIGASLKRQINLSGPYEEMAQSHPDLLYVLTKGAQGEKPSKLNIQYPDSGETIMRSGWGTGDTFGNQTQLIFDVGSYRTNHSDLDALSFDLFGGGTSLMPDAGLYTYEAGPYRSYFHGTRAHNTVVVDGKDQATGEEIVGKTPQVHAGLFEEGNGYVYQSGEEELNQGVSHERAIAMIEDSTIVIFDTLKSSSDHTYEQMFHLFPGAQIHTNGLTLTAKGNDPKQTLTIRQFVTNGIELHSAINQQKPLNGLCSVSYKKAVPCYSISYLQKGQNVSYVTVVSIGENLADIHFDKSTTVLKIKTKNSSYDIKANETQGEQRIIEAKKNFDIATIYSTAQSANLLNAFSEWRSFSDADSEANEGSVIVNNKENSLEISTPTDHSEIEAIRSVDLDLSDKNIYFKFKTNDTFNFKVLDIYLSNNNWTQYAKYDMRDGIYNVTDSNRDNEWLQFGVGKGNLRKASLGNWIKSDPTFDWSKIDGIKLVASSEQGKSVILDVKDFSLVPDQREARAVIIFDDGWSSVMDAAKIMNKYGLKGNVAAITNTVGKRNYLTLDNLETLQNNYGWDIVSHSNLHKNAVVEYVDKNNLQGLNADITDALQYLIQNNINSAPNWYIYPDGGTDGAIKAVIGTYYKFARSTVNGPESFPFPEPLETKIFPAYSDRASAEDIHNAVSDTITYHQTIFLMFHKFTAKTPSVYTEWQLSEFDKVLKDITRQGIKVVTLSELDKENGIPETEFSIQEYAPQQIRLAISVSHNKSSFVTTIRNWLNEKIGL